MKVAVPDHIEAMRERPRLVLGLTWAFQEQHSDGHVGIYSAGSEIRHAGVLLDPRVRHDGDRRLPRVTESTDGIGPIRQSHATHVQADGSREYR